MTLAPGDRDVDVLVVGGGQAGLAAGFHLRRAGLDPVILDAADRPGGAWPRTWDSLRLFSPAAYSSLPGMRMPPFPGPGFPTAGHVSSYLAAYEQRYDLDVVRPVRVTSVRAEEARPDSRLVVESEAGATWRARGVVSATGTWERPFWPAYSGMAGFRGRHLHAADYRRPEGFEGARVVVVGGGNTAAQLLAEVSTVAHTTWVAPRPPRFMPDDVDGRVLFGVATRRRRALDAGDTGDAGVGGLGDIVMVPPVREARDRGVLDARPMFSHVVPDGVAWRDGSHEPADVILWCTGFRPALAHLAPLHLGRAHGVVPTVPVGPVAGTRAAADPRVHLLGYGDWTGPASATLIGVGRTARDAARDLADLPFM
ncbi:NAD(P)/FAD-dependent oxidoreductase [Nocardioides euryhalodurans]|uniref:NAD(P)/FAD-dependent oxidoreductase n=1 Tax=Nocardioides euryhalodurans TaxID=2518370 RepID=A0A4P7GNK9_9ACTN|nr:NAD(P)/FAD-dependent oxidoreductase [Nocardioides euryhalodurans]